MGWKISIEAAILRRTKSRVSFASYFLRSWFAVTISLSTPTTGLLEEQEQSGHHTNVWTNTHYYFITGSYADDDSLDPDSYSDGLVLGCVRLPFTGSLSSTCLHVCLGHGHPRKYGLHITDTWISNQSVVYPEEECPVTSIIRPVELVPPPRPHLLHGHPVGDPDLDLRQMAPGHGAVLVHLRPTASNSGRLQVLL